MGIDKGTYLFVRQNQLVQLLTRPSPIGIEIGQKQFLLALRLPVGGIEVGLHKFDTARSTTPSHQG